MFTAFDSDPNPILTPEYGELIFRYNKWGQDETSGEFYDEYMPLSTHYCTDEELGLIDISSDVDYARFLPIRR